jgi:lysozyme family protein
MASYPYGSKLKREYREMFDAAIIRPDGISGVASCVASIEKNKGLYQGIASQIGCPWWFVGLIHGMEIGYKIGWLANGDPLSGATTHEPKGLVVPGKRAPYDFVDAAIVSLKHEALEKETDWSLEHCLYLLEAYNGFGYRGHGDNSDYLWSFTNFEKPGRYTADGEWNPTAMSGQIGCVAMLKGLMAKGLVKFESDEGNEMPTEIFLKITRTGRSNSRGLEVLKLEVVNGAGEVWLCHSGAPGRQVFQKGAPGNIPGTLYPCPQGEYSVEDISWANGKDNYSANHGPGLGPVFVPFNPKFATKRGAFGFHVDENAATSPGSAGCIVLDNIEELKRFVAMLRKYDPRRLSVQWGL